MNKIFQMIRGTQEEMYFAHETKKDEVVEKTLKEFEDKGWKLKSMLTVPEETFYRIKFEYVYNKHMTYLGLYHSGTVMQTEDKIVDTKDLAFKTARVLVILGNTIIDSNYDVRIPELVHQYINFSFFNKADKFREMVLS
jgi:hypothetical protein